MKLREKQLVSAFKRERQTVKILQEFQPHVPLEHLNAHIYEEVH